MRDDRLKIGLDIDGCLADFDGGFFKLTRELFGKPGPEVREPLHWDFDDILTQDEVTKAWAHLRRQEDWWESLDRMPDTDLLNEAVALHNRIYFITHRVSTGGLPVEVQTARWLTEYFNLYYPTVIVTRGSKGPIAAALELNYFLDDKPENCLEVFDHIGPKKSYLHDAAYNRDLGPVKEFLPRVASVNEFLRSLPDARREM